MPPSVKSFQTVQDAVEELTRTPAGVRDDQIVNAAKNSRPGTQSDFQIPDFTQSRRLHTPSGNIKNGSGLEAFGANVPESETLPPPVEPRTHLPALSQAFKVLQQWEGTVLSRNGDQFEALVRDAIEKQRPEERATIKIDEVTEDDRLLIMPGAIFFWTIGYLIRKSGRSTSSVIRFRRLPQWSSFELERANQKSHEFEYILGDRREPPKNSSSE